MQKQILEKQQLESQINAAEAARLAANEARRRAQEEADERAMAARAKREAQELELQFKRRQFQIDEQKRLADIQWEEEERRHLAARRTVEEARRKEWQEWSQCWLAKMADWIEKEIGRHALKRGLDVVRDELAHLSPDDTTPFIQRALVSALFDAFFDEIEQIRERENEIRVDRLLNDLAVEFSAGLRRDQVDEVMGELRSAAASGVEEVALRFRAASLHRQFLADLRAERHAEEEFKRRQKRADDEAYSQAAAAQREAQEREDRARRTAQEQQYEAERQWRTLELGLQERIDRALPQGATYAEGFDATTAARSHLKHVRSRLSVEDAEQEVDDVIEEHRERVEERLTRERESERKRQEVDRWVNRLPWSVSSQERNEVRSELSQRYDETRGSPEFEEDARALVDEFG